MHSRGSDAGTPMLTLWDFPVVSIEGSQAVLDGGCVDERRLNAKCAIRVRRAGISRRYLRRRGENLRRGQIGWNLGDLLSREPMGRTQQQNCQA